MSQHICGKLENNLLEIVFSFCHVGFRENWGYLTCCQTVSPAESSCQPDSSFFKPGLSVNLDLFVSGRLTD